MKIVPSILAEHFEDFLSMIEQAESFTNYVQIDLMDGIFVETVSFPQERINSVNTSLSFEVHLMTSDPLSFISKVDHRGLRKVIFHREAEVDHKDVINRIKARDLDAGLAIRPETGLNEFGEIEELADTLLFLTVEPGDYGHPFRPEVLQKVSKARKRFPGKAIGVDGGVSLDNLKTVLDAGADYACVGSKIFLNGSPGENYRLFTEKVRELQRR